MNRFTSFALFCLNNLSSFFLYFISTFLFLTSWSWCSWNLLHFRYENWLWLFEFLLFWFNYELIFSVILSLSFCFIFVFQLLKSILQTNCFHVYPDWFVTFNANVEKLVFTKIISARIWLWQYFDFLRSSISLHIAMCSTRFLNFKRTIELYLVDGVLFVINL
jgi:hypothetical protein